MNSNKRIKCLNCGTVHSGSYCWNCGQKASTSRFKLKEMIEEIIFSPLHIHQHGLLSTFLLLIKAPGDSIRKYVTGQRQLLHAPFRYLVLAGTLATLIMAAYHPFDTETEMAEGILFLNAGFFQMGKSSPDPYQPHRRSHLCIGYFFGLPLYSVQLCGKPGASDLHRRATTMDTRHFVAIFPFFAAMGRSDQHHLFCVDRHLQSGGGDYFLQSKRVDGLSAIADGLSECLSHPGTCGVFLL